MENKFISAVVLLPKEVDIPIKDIVDYAYYAGNIDINKLDLSDIDDVEGLIHDYLLDIYGDSGDFDLDEEDINYIINQIKNYGNN